jgi:hypothetical protein
MKETLEEALNKLKKQNTVLNLYPSNLIQNVAEFGAKWQAERMYSKKEVMDMFDTFSMYLPLHYKFLLEEELKKE